ncbi:transglutaminase 5 [Pelomyxa schiedti]|nr:transglutaminase 5 [Pelomyxa schiedti]
MRLPYLRMVCGVQSRCSAFVVLGVLMVAVAILGGAECSYTVDCQRDINQGRSGGGAGAVFDVIDTISVRRGNEISVSIQGDLVQNTASMALYSYDDGAKLSLVGVKATRSSSGVIISGTIPVSAPVGSYYPVINSVNIQCNFFVSFNPWHSSDDAYCSSDAYRAAHMQSTTGLVFLDSVRIDYALTWSYDQYWRSSTEILQRHVTWGFAPVRYAQCWVFAAVLTSLLRGMGIVTRQVMCQPCAHNVAESTVTEMFFDSHGTNCCCKDFWWNFIIAIDGTYAVGPAPRTAIDAQTYGNFDVQFFLSEVKSSVTYYHPKSGVQMYELDPIIEDKTPRVWIMSIGSTPTSTAFEITGDYRSGRSVLNSPSTFGVSVAQIKTTSSNTFGYEITASRDVSLSVLASVSLGDPNVPCRESNLESDTFKAKFDAGESRVYTLKFGSVSQDTAYYVYYRVFLRDTGTEQAALWQRKATPLSLVTTALRVRTEMAESTDQAFQDTTTPLCSSSTSFNGRV